MIYFIQGEKGGPIKIGYTENWIKSRLASLQVGSPQKLEIICLVQGNKAMEKRIHNTFVSSRLQGEWFSPDMKVLDYIEYLHSNGLNIEYNGEKMVGNKIQVTISLEKEIVDAIQRLADDQKRSLSNMIGVVLQAWLERVEKGEIGKE